MTAAGEPGWIRRWADDNGVPFVLAGIAFGGSFDHGVEEQWNSG